jgi:hypothetical protein
VSAGETAQEALLFEKRSKNFCLLRAQHAINNSLIIKVFWFFFSKKNRLPPLPYALAQPPPLLCYQGA